MPSAVPGSAVNAYNNEPGSGRTGFFEIPPNNYDWYSEDEKYKPNVQADGGILSKWEPMYNPTPEQAEADRKKAFETNTPHGYLPAGDKYAGQPTIRLLVTSELHNDEEYGGPFWIDISPKMTAEDLRSVIYKACGVIPGIQRLSFAGKKMHDPARTLEHYGVKYWNAKFPHWPIVMVRHG